MTGPEPQITDYRWLIEGSGRTWLEQSEIDPAPLTELTQRLRKQLTPTRARLIVTQTELRKRAASRFPHAHQMFLTDRALQQATDETIATYKASRFSHGQPVVDVGCGIGGDLLALAERGPVLGIERDASLAYLAMANLRSRRLEQAWTSVGDANQLSILPDVAIHLDPDRRPSERRSVQLEHHEPGPCVMQRWIEHPGGFALKLAPATDATNPLLKAAELEWVGHHRHCQQLVAWFGPLAHTPGQRVATVLSNGGRPSRLAASEIPPLPIGSQIGQFLVEPAACVLAAGLAAVVAQQHQLVAVTAGGGYLTGDHATADAWSTCFEVLEVMPFRAKRLSAWLHERNIGRLEIKKRGVAIDPSQLLRQLRPKGDQPATLILLKQGPRVVVVVSRRMSPAAPGSC